MISVVLKLLISVCLLVFGLLCSGLMDLMMIFFLLLVSLVMVLVMKVFSGMVCGLLFFLIRLVLI